MVKAETILWHAIRDELQKTGWLVEKSHGNLYQQGWPDLFCCHKDIGPLWIEVKTIKGVLSNLQKTKFELWHKHGVKIYIITRVSDLYLIYHEPNWWRYL